MSSWRKKKTIPVLQNFILIFYTFNTVKLFKFYTLLIIYTLSLLNMLFSLILTQSLINKNRKNNNCKKCLTKKGFFYLFDVLFTVVVAEHKVVYIFDGVS